MNPLPFELINVISSFQDNISDVSKFRRTCKSFQKLPLTPRKNDNSLLILLQMYPDKDWDLETINSLISWDIVYKYPEMPYWRYSYLSRNHTVTPEIVKNNSHLAWDYKIMSENPNLTVDFIRSRTDWDYGKLSMNLVITPETVRNNLDIPWDKFGLNYNSNFDSKDLTELDMLHLPSYVHNPNITDEDLDKFGDKLLLFTNRSALNRCKGISLNYILSHPEYDWNYDTISDREEVNESHLNSYPHLNWNKIKILYRCNKEKLYEFVVNSEITFGIIRQILSLVTEGFLHSDELTSTLKLLEGNEYIQYIFMFIVGNHNIPIEKIISFLGKHQINGQPVLNCYRIITELPQRTDLTWNIVRDNPQIDWIFKLMFLKSY